MADEETPFDDLDIGYFEMPIPNTEEYTVIRFLDKTGVSRLWQKIKDKFIRPTGEGSSGQFLTYNAPGVYYWSSVDIPETPQASDTQYGIVRFATDAEFNSFMNFDQE